MKVLLCTIAIGEQYLNMYNKLFRKSHEAYAKKHGYSFKVFEDFLDTNIHHYNAVSFNKILVCSKSNEYDLIIFVDADILINPNSPPLHTIDYNGKIGVVDEFSQPTKEKRLEIQIKENYADKTANEFYKLCGFDINTEMVFNTGLLVMNPKLHSNFLQSIYDKYVITSLTHYRGFIFEETCISYEIIKNNMYYVLPNKFNALWALEKMSNSKADLELFYKENYFAGKCDIDKVHLLT
jgi:hypothetical protein